MLIYLKYEKDLYNYCRTCAFFYNSHRTRRYYIPLAKYQRNGKTAFCNVYA